MASGRDNQITKQIGEYLACVELCRRNFIATTFSGSIPDFDIVAVNEDNKAIPIQVKTIKSGTCQLNAKDYLEIDFNNYPKQKIIGKKRYKQEIIYIFIKLGLQSQDRFYILTLSNLQDMVYKNYYKYLKEHNWVRPNNPKSTHTDISENQLSIFKDNWALLNNIFGLKT